MRRHEGVVLIQLDLDLGRADPEPRGDEAVGPKAPAKTTWESGWSLARFHSAIQGLKLPRPYQAVQALRALER